MEVTNAYFAIHFSSFTRLLLKIFQYLILCNEAKSLIKSSIIAIDKCTRGWIVYAPEIYGSHALFLLCSPTLLHFAKYSAVFSMQISLKLAHGITENDPLFGDDSVRGSTIAFWGPAHL